MNRNLRIIIPIAAIAVLVLGYVGYQYLIVADSPDEVSTESALDQLSEDLAEEADAEQEVTADPETEEVAGGDEVTDDEPVDESTGSEASPAGAEGVWVVDDDFGDFAFENASGSFAGFRVDKELFVGGVQVAVGRSGDVSGSITIADGTVSAGEIVVVTTSLESDIGARTNAVRDAVKAEDFGTATFAITSSTAIDTAALEAGDTVAADIVGDLTIAGVTNTETISAEATIAEDGIALIIGTADLVWADYDVDTPNSSAGTVAESGILEFQLIVRLG
ncbi:MAG: YceI family protein [Actinomycetota bacterium]